ncbi:hypothetical protein BYT27DRAFT_7209338 [Phlegmacium glaucopus]|nr:hypothetical protein BYT27DRAFT_7209338 [Phlegmacium glaucopus]
MAKVTVKTAQEQFQVGIDPSQSMAELKAEINMLKGYATKNQKLIHSGKSFCSLLFSLLLTYSPGKLLTDTQIIGTLGLQEADFLILLISKEKPLGPVPTGDPTAIPVEPLSQTFSFPPSLSIKGKEVIRHTEQTSDETLSTEIAIPNRPQLIGPSAAAPRVSQPPQPSSSSLSALLPNVLPALSGQNHDQVRIAIHYIYRCGRGLGALGNTGDFASMIRTNPSIRQRFLAMATQKDPAFGQQLSQNPALLDTLLRMASTQAHQEDHPSLQTGAFNTEEREAIQRLVDIGFNEKQVIEAYLVSDKNEDHAINYLLSTDAERPSDAHAKEESSIEQLNDPLFRQRLTQFIGQQDPALAQQIKQNPALFEAALQEATLQKWKNLASIGRKPCRAYLICDKNEEHAINYLINQPDSGLDDSRAMVLPEGSGQVPDHSTAKLTSQTEDALEAVALSHTQVLEKSGQSMATAPTQGGFGAHHNTQLEGLSSLTQLVPGSPAFRQRLDQYMREQDPALHRLCNENPGLLDQAINMACVDGQQALPSFQANTLKDKEAIRRLVDFGFDERQATEAYLVSDKNEELALNYILDQQ